MNDEMRQALEKIDKLISKKGFVYALIMAQIEDDEEDSQWLKDYKGYDKDEFCDIASKIKQTISTVNVLFSA